MAEMKIVRFRILLLFKTSLSSLYSFRGVEATRPQSAGKTQVSTLRIKSETGEMVGSCFVLFCFIFYFIYLCTYLSIFVVQVSSTPSFDFFVSLDIYLEDEVYRLYTRC